MLASTRGGRSMIVRCPGKGLISAKSRRTAPPPHRAVHPGTTLAAEAAAPTVSFPPPKTEADLTPTRKLFYTLINPELADQEALAAAKAFIDTAHQETVRAIFGSDAPEQQLHQPFKYSEEALDHRLDLIYKGLAAESDMYDPEKDSIYGGSKERVHERLRQFSPMNLTDGMWLSGIAQLPGPKTRAQCLLLHILADEFGNGDPAYNHCNVYRDLLMGESIYLPEVGSEDFARHPALWEEAFVLPVYMLAIAKFPVTCYAFTLGITMAFEWTAISLTSTIKLFRSVGIDDHFYKLHKGIDNPITGHGAWAVEAVKLYLAEILSTQGEEAQQAAWDKIWLGYVTYDTYGSLDTAFHRWVECLQKPPKTLHQQMVDMVKSKQYASLSHSHAFLDGSHTHHVRDMFQDPDAFVRMLGSNPKLVTPGKPDESHIIHDMGFDGPMFRVFTEKEQQLFRDWITSLAAPDQPAASDPSSSPVSMLSAAAIAPSGEHAVPGPQMRAVAAAGIGPRAVNGATNGTNSPPGKEGLEGRSGFVLPRQPK